MLLLRDTRALDDDCLNSVADGGSAFRLREAVGRCVDFALSSPIAVKN